MSDTIGTPSNEDAFVKLAGDTQASNDASETFRKASYAKQKEIRAKQFNLLAPLITGLDPQVQDLYSQAFLDKDPVMADDSRPEVQEANDTIARLGVGDEVAKENFSNGVIAQRAMKASLIANVAVGVGDTLAELWNPGNDESSYLFGKERDKLNDYVIRNAVKQGSLTKDDVDAIGTSGSILSGGVTIAESLLTQGLFVGSLAKGGLLTKGAMSAVAQKAASMAPGIGRQIVAGMGEQAVQAAIGAGLSALDTGVKTLVQDDDMDRSLGGFASRYGKDLATDWLCWAAMGAIGTTFKVGKAILHHEKFEKGLAEGIFKSGETATDAFAERLAKGEQIDPEVWEQFSPEAKKDLLFRQRMAHEAKVNLNIPTPESEQKSLTLCAGYFSDVDETTGKVKIYAADHLDEEKFVGEFNTPIEALDWSVKNPPTYVANAPVDAAGVMAQESDRAGVIAYKDKFRINKDSYDPYNMSMLLKADENGNYDPKQMKFIGQQLGSAYGGRVKWKTEDFDLHLSGDDVPNVELGSDLQLDNDFKIKYGPYQSEAAQAAVDAKIGEFRDKIQEGVIPIVHVSTPAQERMYLNLLKTYMPENDIARGALSDTVDRIVIRKIDTNALAYSNPLSVEHLFSVTHGGEPVSLKKDLSTGGELYQLWTKGVGDTWTKEADFKDLVEARATAISQFISSGKVSLQAINVGLGTSTGRIIRANSDNTFSLVKKGLKGETSSTIDTDKTVLGLMSRHTELLSKMALPAECGPALRVIDPGKRVMEFSGNVMVGNAHDVFKDMSQYIDPFSGTKNKVFDVKISAVNGKLKREPITAELDAVSRTLTYKPFAGGVPQEFDSVKSLTEHLEGGMHTMDDMRLEAKIRGYQLYADGKGHWVLNDGVNNPERFSTIDALKARYAQEPIAEIPELISTLDSETLKRIDKDIAHQEDIVHTPREDRYNAEKGYTKLRDKLTNWLTSSPGMAYFSPTRSTLEVETDRMGDPSMLKLFDDHMLAKRAVNKFNHSSIPIVQDIWAGTKPSERMVTKDLLGIPEVDREAYAALHGIKYTDKMRESILDMLKYMQKLCDYTHIGPVDEYLNFGNTVNEAVNTLKAMGKDVPNDIDELMRASNLGPVPQFFRQYKNQLSVQSFLEDINEDDPALMLLHMTNRASQLMYMKPLQHSFAEKYITMLKAYDEGGPKAPKASFMKYMQSTMEEMTGEKTAAGAVLNEGTQRATRNFARKLSKMPFFKDLGLDDTVRIDDLIGKLGGEFTFVSQAGRIWTIPRNLMQDMNLSAVTGNIKTLKAHEYVMAHPEYMEALRSRQAIEETMYDVGGETLSSIQATRKFLMSPLEVTDNITRATAIRSAEMVIEDARPRYLKGITNADQYIREINGDLLGEQDKLTMLKLTKVNPNAAADFLGTRYQSWTMYDYAKEAQGLASRGTLGRLWGKLGVYPLWTLDLYRRVLSSGSTVDRLARMTRMATTSAAAYWAFKQAGIPYDGFLWTSAFGFSGGPFFQNGIDVLQMWGDSPEAKMARSRLKRNVPRELIAPVAWADYYKRAASAAEDNDPVEFCKAIAMAPTTPEARKDLLGR